MKYLVLITCILINTLLRSSEVELQRHYNDPQAIAQLKPLMQPIIAADLNTFKQKIVPTIASLDWKDLDMLKTTVDKTKQKFIEIQDEQYSSIKRKAVLSLIGLGIAARETYAFFSDEIDAQKLMISWAVPILGSLFIYTSYQRRQFFKYKMPVLETMKNTLERLDDTKDE